MNPDELKALIEEALTHGGEVLSREELRELMHDAVVDAMSTLGIDARNPMDVQKDMLFIRELRLTTEKIKSRTILTLVGIVIAAAAGATWLGFKTLLGS